MEQSEMINNVFIVEAKVDVRLEFPCQFFATLSQMGL
jgi:hypothetical protein